MLLYVSTLFVTIGAELMVQSTVIILAGLCLSSVLRNHGAAVQSLILRLFLVAVFLCPLVTVLFDFNTIPVFEIDLPRASLNHASTVPPHPVSPSNIYGVSTGAVPEEAGILREPIHAGKPGDSSTGSTLPSNNGIHLSQPGSAGEKQQEVFLTALVYIGITLLWASGTLFFIVRLIVYSIRILTVRATAAEAHPDVMKRGKELANRMEVETPLFLESDRVRSPFLTGIFRPAVILPRGMVTTGEILIHELAHLVRRDCNWNLLSHIGIALLPFQPLIRILNRRIEETSDFVCDDYVVEHGMSSLAYARQLVSLAERFHPVPFEVTVGVGILSLKSSLLARIERILEDSRHILLTVRAGTAVKAAVMCLLITVLTGFVGIRTNGFSSPDSRILPLQIVSESSLAVVFPGVSTFLTDDMEKAIAFSPAVMKKSDRQPAQVLSPVTGNNSSSRVKSTGQSANDSEAVISSIPSSPAEAVTTTDTPVPVPVEVSRESASTALNVESQSRNSKEAGMKLLNKGNNTGAETVFLKGLEFDPDNPDILNCLGLASYAQAKIKQAKIFFKTAIAVDKNHAEAYYNLGDVLFDEGNLNAAMEQYKIALDINPALSRKKRPFYVGDTVAEIRSHN